MTDLTLELIGDYMEFSEEESATRFAHTLSGLEQLGDAMAKKAELGLGGK